MYVSDLVNSIIPMFLGIGMLMSLNFLDAKIVQELYFITYFGIGLFCFGMILFVYYMKKGDGYKDKTEQNHSSVKESEK